MFAHREACNDAGIAKSINGLLKSKPAHCLAQNQYPLAIRDNRHEIMKLDTKKNAFLIKLPYHDEDLRDG